MKVAPEEIQRRLDRCKNVIRRSGMKLTHQRLEIFREVARTGDHPDAETIFKGVRKRMPTVSLDTVYRTLWMLMDLGLITTLGPPRERAKFDANMSAHHHFVCTRCGRARDFYSQELNTVRIPDVVMALGSVERTYVEFRGLCSCCSRKKEK